MRKGLVLALCLFLVFVGVCQGDEMTVITYQIVTADGVTFDLEDGVFQVFGLENIGRPGVRAYLHQVPGQPGAVLDDMLDDVRTVQVMQSVHGADAEAVFAAINDVADNYRYNRTLTLQPLRLRVTSAGTAADLYCYYGGQVISTIDNVHALMGFTLNAYDPYFYATTETSKIVQCSNHIDENSIIGLLSGVWTELGEGTPGGGADVRSIAVDNNDDLYITPWTSNWTGIGAADYIAFYDKSGGTYSAVGTGLQNVAYKVLIGPNGYVYVGGTFTAAGGVGSTLGIAYWDGSAYNALGAGGDDNSVFDLVMDSAGNLYAGGNFTGMGGVGNTPGIAKWDGSAWTALGTGVDDNAVNGLAIDANDNLFATGSFTGMGGVGDTAYIAKWDGTNWTALSTGLDAYGNDIIFDQNGTLYVTGNFGTAGGVTCAKIAKWNGLVFQPLGDGFNGVGHKMGISPENEVYASGAFTTAGSMGALRIARWNGSSWRPAPLGMVDGTAYSFVWDSDEDFYCGFVATDGVIVAHVEDITHSGNIDTPPSFDVQGEGTLTLLSNTTTEDEIPADLAINEGETISVNLGLPGMIPGKIEVVSDWIDRPNGDNLLGKILAPAKMASFNLAGAPLATAGVNKVGILVADQPVETGDNNTQLSRWGGITGIDDTNTDDGRVYVSIVDDGGGFFHVDIYEDSGKAALVGHTATYNAAGSEAIVADNASGLGGTLYIDAATAADVDIEVLYALATIGHWDRYDSFFAAVD